MDPYDIYRNGKEYFTPKTPIAALKAFEGGFIPISAFINLSNSTKPLNEEPYDIEGIERLLSRKNLKLKSNTILMNIFEKLIFNSDQEIALFAAESINIIENRYNRQIQEQRKILKERNDPKALSRLGTLYFELAVLNEKRAAIKDFYFKEALTCFTKLDDLQILNDDELNTYIRLLVELKLSDEAAEYLEREDRGAKPFPYLLLAEVEFARKNYSRVREICLEMREDQELTKQELETFLFWTGA
jgi:tetratricopeptide (TPR) repeat protein